MKVIEKIRLMSSDELAEFLCDNTCTLLYGCSLDFEYKENIKEWLESETEDD